MLGDKQPASGVERHGHGIAHQRFGRRGFETEPGGELERGRGVGGGRGGSQARDQERACGLAGKNTQPVHGRSMAHGAR